LRIAVAIDHAGVSLRETVSQAVRDAGHELVDLGCHDDYPDSALDMGRAIAAGDADRGILVCGSGAGVSVAASKLAGIRASVCHDHYTAAQCQPRRLQRPVPRREGHRARDRSRADGSLLRGAVQRRGAPCPTPRKGP